MPITGSSQKRCHQSLPNHEKRRSRERSAFYKLAGWTGLEPATFCVTGRRSNQLSYHPVKGERRRTLESGKGKSSVCFVQSAFPSENSPARRPIAGFNPPHFFAPARSPFGLRFRADQGSSAPKPEFYVKSPCANARPDFFRRSWVNGFHPPSGIASQPLNP